MFYNDDNATVYYLPGTTGYGPVLGGRPTVLWKPHVQTGDASFGVRTNRFGFNITWASGRVIVVEACTNLANPRWFPLGTNTLNDGWSYFSDPQWTNYPVRLYRLRTPSAFPELHPSVARTESIASESASPSRPGFATAAAA